MKSVDINADLGEGTPGEAELFGLVSSVNIACGGHAGDVASMQAALRLARTHGVAVGAHPGYVDRKSFGRKELDLPASEITALVVKQVSMLVMLARGEGLRVSHVKPHGSLYNQAVRDDALATAVVAGILQSAPGAGIFAPEGSALARAAALSGLTVWREAFVDRGYESSGRLVPRGSPGALLNDQDAVRQAVEVVVSGRVQAVFGDWIPCGADTLCVHGDGTDARALLSTLTKELGQRGVVIRAPLAR